ncbi:hypothetical protein V1527DRAFT_281168 [Lipomyces starkeyi]
MSRARISGNRCMMAALNYYVIEAISCISGRSQRSPSDERRLERFARRAKSAKILQMHRRYKNLTRLIARKSKTHKLLCRHEATKGCQPALDPECCATPTEIKKLLSHQSQGVSKAGESKQCGEVSILDSPSATNAQNKHAQMWLVRRCGDSQSERAEARCVKGLRHESPLTCETLSNKICFAELDSAQPSLGALRALWPGPWRRQSLFYIYMAVPRPVVRFLFIIIFITIVIATAIAR